MANRQNPFFNQEIIIRLTSGYHLSVEAATSLYENYKNAGNLSRSKVKPFTFEILAWAIYNGYTLDDPKVTVFI